MSPTSAQAAVEQVARDGRGRLLAYLAPRAGGYLASAEDALAEAFLAALQQWPEQGVPERPEAWLLSVARRRLIDVQRRGAVRQEAEPALRAALEQAGRAVESGHDFPDERLALLFVCAHPAIDAAARAPLMLQVVLGVESARMAAVFLVTPEAMAQRLVRAKAKIRAAGVPFRVPEAGELTERLEFVLDAIYAAFTIETIEDGGGVLAREAMALARLLHGFLPGEPEVAGLLALQLHCEARRAARLDADGNFVPLLEQDVRRWDRQRILEAEVILGGAVRAGRMGRFQIEAAIQSAHARRLSGASVPWRAVVDLYTVLGNLTPAWGARIGRALALGELEGAAVGWQALAELPVEVLADSQSYWAARAHLAAAMGAHEVAAEAYQRAADLARAEPVRRFLLARAEVLS